MNCTQSLSLTGRATHNKSGLLACIIGHPIVRYYAFPTIGLERPISSSISQVEYEETRKRKCNRLMTGFTSLKRICDACEFRLAVPVILKHVHACIPACSIDPVEKC